MYLDIEYRMASGAGLCTQTHQTDLGWTNMLKHRGAHSRVFTNDIDSTLLTKKQVDLKLEH